jgi:hypothetical protein
MSFIMFKTIPAGKGIQDSKTFPNQIRVYKLWKMSNLDMGIGD